MAYPASEGKNGTTPGIGPLLTTAKGNQSQVTEGRKGRHNFWGGDPTTSPPAAFTLENSLRKKLGCPRMYKKNLYQVQKGQGTFGKFIYS